MIISIHLIIQTNKASAWNLVQTSHRHASYFGYWDPRPHILSKSELNIHSSFTRRLSLSGKLAINHLARCTWGILKKYQVGCMQNQYLLKVLYVK